jgi:hypothetical protein
MEIQAISSTAATLAQSQTTQANADASKANKAAPPPPPPPATPPPPPPPKPVASSESGTGNSSSNSSTAKIYDRRDEDQDGTVTYQEALLYSLKHPPEETEVEPAVTPSQMQAGLNSYKQNEVKTSLFGN